MRWRDENNLNWLDVPPSLTMLNEQETRRDAYPLTGEQQRIFFAELPGYLHRMALFKVNTGCRKQEVCRVKWEYEIKVQELNATVFLIPWNFGERRPRSKISCLTRVSSEFYARYSWLPGF